MNQKEKKDHQARMTKAREAQAQAHLLKNDVVREFYKEYPLHAQLQANAGVAQVLQGFMQYVATQRP